MVLYSKRLRRDSKQEKVKMVKGRLCLYLMFFGEMLKDDDFAQSSFAGELLLIWGGQ